MRLSRFSVSHLRVMGAQVEADMGVAALEAEVDLGVAVPGGDKVKIFPLPSVGSAMNQHSFSVM